LSATTWLPQGNGGVGAGGVPTIAGTSLVDGLGEEQPVSSPASRVRPIVVTSEARKMSNISGIEKRKEKGVGT
jgi:hypothetical protein